MELLLKTKEANEIFQTIMVIKFWQFLIFYQNFLSLQMKRSAIINNKHGTYELTHKLPNDLKAHSQVWDNFWQLKALWKWWKMLFISTLKAYLILKIFKFLYWDFGHIDKRLDHANHRIYDIKAWLTNSCNIPTAQYLEK